MHHGAYTSICVQCFTQSKSKCNWGQLYMMLYDRNFSHSPYVYVSTKANQHTFGLKLSLNICSCFRGPSLGSNSFNSSSVRDARMSPEICSLFIASAVSSPTSPLTFWYSSSTFSFSSWMAIPIRITYVCCSVLQQPTICSSAYWLTAETQTPCLYTLPTYCCAGGITWLHPFVGKCSLTFEGFNEATPVFSTFDLIPAICCIPLTQILCRWRWWLT